LKAVRVASAERSVELASNPKPLGVSAHSDGIIRPPLREADGYRSTGPRRAFGGILIVKECLTFSRSVRLALAAVCVGVMLGAMRSAHPFLVVMTRIQEE